MSERSKAAQHHTPRRAQRRLAIPLSPTEHEALGHIAASLGYSTQQFARILFMFSVAHIAEIRAYVAKLRGRLS